MKYSPYLIILLVCFVACNNTSSSQSEEPISSNVSLNDSHSSNESSVDESSYHNSLSNSVDSKNDLSSSVSEQEAHSSNPENSVYSEKETNSMNSSSSRSNNSHTTKMSSAVNDINSCSDQKHYSSSSVTVNQKPRAAMVGISGDIIQNSILKGNYLFLDKEHDLEGTSIYKWYRDDVLIPGATDTNYTITYADSGKAITFEVTPVSQSEENNTGLSVVSNPTSLIEGYNAPVAKSLRIEGYVGAGEVLTGHYEFMDRDGDSEGATSFKWFIDDVEIAGETDSTYVMKDSDAGKDITFEVTPVALTTYKSIGISVSEPLFLSRNFQTCAYDSSANTLACNEKSYKTMVFHPLEPISYFNPVIMAENLNFATNTGSYCYDDLESNCDTYGRLYTWDVGIFRRSSLGGVCPTGWKVIPSLLGLAAGTVGKDKNEEIDTGFSFMSYILIGQYLRSTSGWDNSENGSDDYGFNGLPGGIRLIDGTYSSKGTHGQWWSANTESTVDESVNTGQTLSKSDAFMQGNARRERAYSIRCVKY